MTPAPVTPPAALAIGGFIFLLRMYVVKIGLVCVQVAW